METWNRLSPLVTLMTVLWTVVAAGLKGHSPRGSDAEGRYPSSLLVSVPASVLLPTVLDETVLDSNSRASYSQLAASLNKNAIPVDLKNLEHEEKLQSYFSYFKLPPGVCQQRLVCALAADPELYEPVSTLFLQELLTAGSAPASPGLREVDSPDFEDEVYQTELTRFQQLRTAADGRGHCDSRYSGCPLQPEAIISLSALRLWSWGRSLISMQFNSLEL